MVGSDTSPRVPEEFVRYDESGTVPGSSYVITATTQAIVDDIAVPKISATDIANIANAIKEGKSVSVYDVTSGIYFIPMIVEQFSFIMVMFNPFVVVKYRRVEGDMVLIKVYNLKFPTL